MMACTFSCSQLHSRNIPVQVVFGGNMDGAIAQRASGKWKAEGVNSQLTAGWPKRENRPVRALWQSDSLHDLPLMAAKTVPTDDLQAVSRAFIEMGNNPQEKKILANAAALVKWPVNTVFVVSNGREYSAYRNF